MLVCEVLGAKTWMEVLFVLLVMIMGPFVYDNPFSLVAALFYLDAFKGAED